MIVFTPIWQRPEITEIYCLGVQRLNLKAFCVVSPEDKTRNKEIIKDYGFEVFETPNYPLGRKKNAGLEQLMKNDFDYLIELNSDDLLRNEALEFYETLTAERCPFFGLSEFLVYDIKSGESVINRSSTMYGIGRGYSKASLTGKTLWADHENKGMDNRSYAIMVSSGLAPRKIKADFPLAIDLKSDVNIWGFDKMKNRRGSEVYKGDPLEGLSLKERERILSLKADN